MRIPPTRPLYRAKKPMWKGVVAAVCCAAGLVLAEGKSKWDLPDFYYSGISTFAHLPHERCLICLLYTSDAADE